MLCAIVLVQTQRGATFSFLFLKFLLVDNLSSVAKGVGRGGWEMVGLVEILQCLVLLVQRQAPLPLPHAAAVENMRTRTARQGWPSLLIFQPLKYVSFCLKRLGLQVWNMY